MAKRRFFMKVMFITVDGTKLEITDDVQPEKTPEMRRASAAFLRALSRYRTARQYETRKASGGAGPTCGTVTASDIARSPGLRLDAEYYLDRLPLEVVERATTIVIDGVELKGRSLKTEGVADSAE